MSKEEKILIVIAGPTASGKTSLAIELAHKLNTEIISADSRQVYHEMKIGTARPEKEELQGITHHCLGHVSIHDEYHAGRFEEEALFAVEKIHSEKKYAIACGGTGLYLSALIHGFDPLPERDQSLRDELEKEYTSNGISFLQDKLKELDPLFFSSAEIYNPQRLIRAIEICIVSGKTHQQLLSGVKKNRRFKTLFYAINHERGALYSRINTRVDEMVSSGLEEEAAKLFPFKNLNALQTVGYKEWFNFFEDKISREDAIDQIKQHTRNYAKRQLTWFRRQENVIWLCRSNDLVTDIVTGTEFLNTENS